MNSTAQNSTPARRENPLLSLLLNIVVPVIILMRFSGDEWLGPVNGLLAALAFPLAYGIFDYSQRRTLNFLPIVGVVGILLTGRHWAAQARSQVDCRQGGSHPAFHRHCRARVAQDSLLARFRPAEQGNRQRSGERRTRRARHTSALQETPRARHVHRGGVILSLFGIELLSGAPGGGESARDNSLQRGVGQDDGPEFPRNFCACNHYPHNSHSLHRRRHSKSHRHGYGAYLPPALGRSLTYTSLRPLRSN